MRSLSAKRLAAWENKRDTAAEGGHAMGAASEQLAMDWGLLQVPRNGGCQVVATTHVQYLSTEASMGRLFMTCTWARVPMEHTHTHEQRVPMVAQARHRWVALSPHTHPISEPFPNHS
jgi:hypothetical protein